jgi:hypothetical protein
VSHYVVGVPVADDVAVEVDDPVFVGLDGLLAEEDGLVGDELPGDFVGLTDLTGFGLPLGFGTGTEALAVWLGVGVSVLDEGWLASWVGGVAGELRCCAVLVSTFPLFRPEM